MLDNDVMILEDARDVVFKLEKEYRRAVLASDLARMAELSPQLDAAGDGLSQARLNLLKEGQIATDADVAEMRRIKGAIDQAANDQQLAAGVLQFVGFIAKFL